MLHHLLYNLFIRLYPFAVRLASPFNAKAKLWLEGRKNTFYNLQKAVAGEKQIIWMHCSSLGEFEQGRPLLEKLRKLYPSYKLLLTFFSPSGYEVQKNYVGANYVFYMPMDSKKTAASFFEIVKPALVVFVKYEFWNYYLQQAKRLQIPVLLISAIFRKSQPFFFKHGHFHRSMLSCFAHIFVQNEESVLLLKTIGFQKVLLAGDTRFDRVTEIAEGFEALPIIEEFIAGRDVIVAGSTWSEDDKGLSHYANSRTNLKFIIAPHNIVKDRLHECLKLYKNAVLFSEINEMEAVRLSLSKPAIEQSFDKLKTTETHNSQLATHNSQLTTHHARIIIMDNIGMLGRLYNYATVAYVGGGFGDEGVHNVLEPAVYGKPVVFGPVYEKYFEAKELVETGGGVSVDNALELETTFDKLLKKDADYAANSKASRDYVHSKKGATEKIISFIQAKRLLTS